MPKANVNGSTLHVSAANANMFLHSSS